MDGMYIFWGFIKVCYFFVKYMFYLYFIKILFIISFFIWVIVCIDIEILNVKEKGFMVIN